MFNIQPINQYLDQHIQTETQVDLLLTLISMNSYPAAFQYIALMSMTDMSPEQVQAMQDNLNDPDQAKKYQAYHECRDLIADMIRHGHLYLSIGSHTQTDIEQWLKDHHPETLE